MKRSLLILVIIVIGTTAIAGNSNNDKGKYTYQSTPPDSLNKITVVNTYDSVVFDLSQAVCSGIYFLIPVSILSDDVVYALDFSMKFNTTKITYDTIVNCVSYLDAAANYNTVDSTLRFTSFSFQQIQNNTPLVSLRFKMLSGQIGAADFNTINVYLNGDKCSAKVIDAPPGAFITASGPTTFTTGDSISLSATAGVGYKYLWSTGATTQSVYVKTTGTYTVSVTNAGGCITSSSMNVIVTSPLPVELVDFYVKENNDGILAAWTTASEINNEYFTVERSADAENWEEIKRIKGAGNSTTLRNYSITDDDPLNNINYYRLKQTDYDGSSEYSEIKMQYYSKQKRRSALCKVYPNPAAGILNVTTSEDASIQLLDAEGKEVFLQTNVNANQRQEINTQNVANGMYMMKIYNDNFVSMKKVVISK